MNVSIIPKTERMLKDLIRAIRDDVSDYSESYIKKLVMPTYNSIRVNFLISKELKEKINVFSKLSERIEMFKRGTSLKILYRSTHN